MSICIRNVIRAARFPWSGPSAPIRATGFKFFCATLKICSRAFHELLAVPAATVPRALVKHSRSVCPRDYRNSAHCDHPNPSENLSIRNVGKDHVIVTLSKSRKNVDERRVCDMPVGGVIHLGWMSTSLKIPSWRDDSNFEATNLPSSRISWPQSDTQPISQLLGKWNMRMLLEVHQLLPWHWLWWNNCCQSPSPIIDLPSSLLKPTARWVAENGWHGGDMHTAFSTWGSKYLKKTHLSLASHWKIILGSWKYVLFLCLFSNLHQTTFERLRVILTDVRLMMNAPPGTCWQAMSIYYFHCLGAPAEPTKTNPQNSWRALQSFYWLMFSSLALIHINPENRSIASNEGTCTSTTSALYRSTGLSDWNMWASMLFSTQDWFYFYDDISVRPMSILHDPGSMDNLYIHHRMIFQLMTYTSTLGDNPSHSIHAGARENLIR